MGAAPPADLDIDRRLGEPWGARRRTPLPRVVFFGLPSRGHVVPSLPVVAEFVRRGVEVDYHVTPSYAAFVEGAGARFVSYPPQLEGLLTAPVRLAQHLDRTMAAIEALPPLSIDVERRPDLVLFDNAALWGFVFARRLGLPSVASITTFALNRALLQTTGVEASPTWSAESFETLNARHGGAFRDFVEMLAPPADGKFVYTSRAFQPAGRFFDPSYVFLGPMVDRRPRDGARALAIGSRPLAYVSLGSILRDEALVFRLSEILAAQGWQVVVSLGGEAPTRAQWPDHVQAHAFVDQIGVLSQARLFITHGGLNSVSEALAHAVPMIVIPHTVDQPLVANQTAFLGAAVMIERDAVSIETLTAAIARIEDNRAAFEAAAARLQKSFSQVTPVAEAVGHALALIGR